MPDIFEIIFEKQNLTIIMILTPDQVLKLKLFLICLVKKEKI